MNAAGLVVVIADDLTGASDAGVQFARRGLRSLVVLDRVDPRLIADVGAVAVDTDTRGLAPDAAYARVREVAEQLRQLEPGAVYKKVDSTLRGNLAAEIDAVLDAFDFDFAVVAPAYPAQGRATRGGIHHLRGVPVHEAEPGRDPKTPVRDADLVRLLRARSQREVVHLGLEGIRAGTDAIRARVVAGGASLFVCDAETDADLRLIAGALPDPGDVLWVGSAGLAEQLVDVLGYRVRDPVDGRRGASGPVLAVVGSPSEVTRRQVVALADHAAHFESSQRTELLAALAAGRDAALVGRSESLAKLAELAADCVREHHVGGLILTGGETARAVCRELGVAAIELVDEVEPGVPLGLLVGSAPDRLPVVTKAGAFGSDKTLLHALERLKGGSST